jgi:putative tryptophan/tyrosine transport system substrate-binding protein
MKALTRRAASVVVLAGLAAPFEISAQQPPTPTIGLLDGSVATAGKAALFYEGLAVEGFAMNRSVQVELHSAAGDTTRLPQLAVDLVHRGVALLAALDTPAALAAKTVTTRIPIVFAVETTRFELGSSRMRIGPAAT